VKAEGTLYGAVTTLPDALSIITKTKRPSLLAIVTGDCKAKSLPRLRASIRICSVVAEVFELLVNDPDGCENMLLTNTDCVIINGNGEDTFYVKRSALFDEPMCDDEGE
jgi:hypothetical protein